MRFRVASLLLALILLSCGDSPTRPGDPIPFQEHPFYYVDDAPYYLDIDSTKLTVATDLAMPEAAARVLAPIHAIVDSAESIPLELAPPGHWIVYLDPGTSIATSVRAARDLRLAPGFSFASNAYRRPSLPGDVMLIDEFIARLLPDGTEEDIVRANGLTGASIVRRADWDSLTFFLSFPDRSAHTPLEIAAFYDQQPGIDHATPNFIFRMPGDGLRSAAGRSGIWP